MKIEELKKFMEKGENVGARSMIGIEWHLIKDKHFGALLEIASYAASLANEDIRTEILSYNVGFMLIDSLEKLEKIK